jgi:carbon monoxide dehydrogenase subunit G
MKIVEEFEVRRPVAEVWDLFQDVPQLAHCLPGAELTEDRGGGRYAGTVAVKLGPLTATFEGEAEVRSDAAEHTGRVEARGNDRRGGSAGQIDVRYRLVSAEEGTAVTVDADVVLRGAAAQFGRTGLIREMASRIVGDFVSCVEAKLEVGPGEPAARVEAGDLKGFSLFFTGAAAAVRRAFARLFRRGDGR